MNAIKLMKQMPYMLLLLIMWLPQWAMAVQIEVSLDRTPVSLDESFQIIFTAAESPDAAPDFAPLEQDFSILNQSQSSNTLFVNGSLSKTVQWTLNVMAKKPGRLTIPAIKFGDDLSKSTSVVVTKDATKKDISHDNELFIDVKASPENPFVQSQVIYTMRLYRKVEITQAKLSEPQLNDAIIEKLGEDSEYNALHNGVNYRVTERKYAIFPQKSGQLAIDPLELTVDVIANTAPSFNDFFNPQATQTKRIVSKKIVLNVKPIPTTFTAAHWLSAEKLELTQQWSGDTQQAKVGEPLTRTLTLQAKSTTVGQLPELNTAKNTDQFKVYPDQPVLQEQKQLEGLLASRQEKIAIIPSQAGSYTLPAIEIPWFNTQSQKVEVASLPAITITAVAAAGTSTTLPTEVKPTTTPIVNSTSPNNTVTKVETPVQQIQPQYNKWLWAACVFLVAGWLITVIYFYVRKPAQKKSVIEQEDNVDVKECIKRLKKACAENDVPSAKAALLEWGQKQFGATSLGATATCCEARLRDEILLLNQILYGKEAEAQWDGKKLYQYFIENKARKSVANKDNSLEPLYRL
jgi:hypothetical protein